MIDDNHSAVTRRELVKTGLGVAVTVAIGASAPVMAARAAAPVVVSKKKTTLRIALIGSYSTAQAQQAKQFEKLHPDVKVDFIAIQAQDWPVYFTKVLTLIQGGQAPDLTYVDTSGIQQFAAEGLAAPLDDYVRRDKARIAEYFADVHPTLVESMMHNGNLYQLPLDFNAVNMYYDPALLAAAGFGVPSASWTKDAFYKIAKATTKKTNGQTTAYGYGWVNRIWGGWTQWANANGSDLLEYGRYPGGEWLWSTFYRDNPAAKGRAGGIMWGQPIANLSANVEALQFAMDLTKEGIAPVPTVSGGGALQNFFAGKKLAMTPGGGFWAGGLHAAGMKPNAFDIQLWPRWKSQRTHFGCAGWILFKSSSNKDAAWEFMKYAASKEAMGLQFVGNNSTPTRRSMMTATRYASTGPAHWQMFYPTLDLSRPFAAPTYYSRLNDSLVKYTGLAVAGNATAQQALDGMQRELQSAYASSPK